MFIDLTGNAGETATVASTMWWLCGVDAVLPVGDIAYGVLVAATACYEYGPQIVDAIGNFGGATAEVFVSA